MRTLPLGVDIGASRVRIALASQERGGSARIVAVASRDTAGDEESLQAALLEEMLAELGSRERRCVIALGPPHAALRLVRFPKMSWAERSRAARFEAKRFVPWDIDVEETQVHVHAVDRETGTYAVGAVRDADLRSRLRLLRASGLRVVAVDHDGFALRRVLPRCDAIVDVGLSRATLHVYESMALHSVHVPAGGLDVTRGIAHELSIDAGSAERRKRILGSAGAGVTSRDDVVRLIADAVEKSRSRAAVTRIALTGNGARLPGFAESLEKATGAIVELPIADLMPIKAYPEDVIRAAAPDWTLAVGLATWGIAG